MLGDASALFTALGNFGAFGVLVAFLIWKDLRAEAQRAKLEQERMSQERLLEERRMAYDRERLEADKATAGAMAALTGAIQGGVRR